MKVCGSLTLKENKEMGEALLGKCISSSSCTRPIVKGFLEYKFMVSLPVLEQSWLHDSQWCVANPVVSCNWDIWVCLTVFPMWLCPWKWAASTRPRQGRGLSNGVLMSLPHEQTQEILNLFSTASPSNKSPSKARLSYACIQSMLWFHRYGSSQSSYVVRFFKLVTSLKCLNL